MKNRLNYFKIFDKSLFSPVRISKLPLPLKKGGGEGFRHHGKSPSIPLFQRVEDEHRPNFKAHINNIGYNYFGPKEDFVNIYLSHSKARLALLLFLTAASAGRAADSSPPPEQKERAVAALEQAVRTDPNNAELWLHLGFAYRKLDRIDQAQNAFEKTAALDPRNQDALYMLGLIYEKKRQTQEALEAWKKYLAAAGDSEKRGVAEKHIHHLSQ